MGETKRAIVLDKVIGGAGRGLRVHCGHFS